MKLCISVPVFVSHNLIIPFVDPDASIVPSGLNATEKTCDLYSIFLCPMIVPVSTFQNFIVPSLDPDASIVPSELNENELIIPVCPVKLRISVPVFVSIKSSGVFRKELP